MPTFRVNLPAEIDPREPLAIVTYEPDKGERGHFEHRSYDGYGVDASVRITSVVAQMKVLIACEFSGIVRDAFIRKGHDAMSCDLLPTERPGPHYQGDVRDVLGDRWDAMIFHAPCTRLCNSGVRWLDERNLWKEMVQAAMFFRELLDAPISRVAGENPIPHRYARAIMGPYTQVIQPWQFGHGETKATGLWLRGLPALKPTNIVAGREQRVFHCPPSKDRWAIRSRTFQGIADAMAEQWGSVDILPSLPADYVRELEQAANEDAIVKERA